MFSEVYDYDRVLINQKIRMKNELQLNFDVLF